MMDREDLRGKVQTVLGLVDPQTLGRTLMHEHLIWDITYPHQRNSASAGEPSPHMYWDLMTGKIRQQSNTAQRDRALATREITKMVDAGGRSIVELTIGGLRPDPEGLAFISKGSGAHIIMGCGYYVDSYQDAVTRTQSIDALAEEIIGQVREGAWGTDVRAGIIGEIGCEWPWTDFEKRALKAAIIAQQETGAALTIHPARHEDHPWLLVEFLRDNGADLSRSVIGHIDRTIFDEERLYRLVDAGVVVEWDLFGQESTYYGHADIDMPNDGMRLRTIRRLVDRGHLDQIVISHDICHTIRLREFGGHGYSHIFESVVPHMRKRGYQPDEIDRILIETPRRLLTLV